MTVTDIDRALAFYTEQVGFILDVDYPARYRFPSCPAHSLGWFGGYGRDGTGQFFEALGFR